MKNDPTYRMLGWYLERATTQGCHSIPIDKDIAASRGGKGATGADTALEVARISVVLRKAIEAGNLPTYLWHCAIDEFNGSKRSNIKSASQRDGHNKTTKEARRANQWLYHHYENRKLAMTIIHSLFHEHGILTAEY